MNEEVQTGRNQYSSKVYDPEVEHIRNKKRIEYALSERYIKRVESRLDGSYNFRYGNQTLDIHQLKDILVRLKNERRILTAIDLAINFYSRVPEVNALLKEELANIIGTLEEGYSSEAEACDSLIIENKILKEQIENSKQQISNLLKDLEIIKLKLEYSKKITQEVNTTSEAEETSEKYPKEWYENMMYIFRDLRTKRDKGEKIDKLLPHAKLVSIRQGLLYKQIASEKGKEYTNNLFLICYRDVVNELKRRKEIVSESEYDQKAIDKIVTEVKKNEEELEDFEESDAYEEELTMR